MQNAKLSVRNISLCKNKKMILDSISCGIEANAITALIGPNGSGKSSLLSVMSGLKRQSSGEVLLNNTSIANYAQRTLAQELSLLPQVNPIPATLTVKDLVSFGRHPHKSWYQKNSSKDSELISYAMHECGIEHYADRLLGSLSGGEMQRCWLAMILAQDTPVVLLDEPTSWLDIPHQIDLLEIVKRLNTEHNKTIVWVLHDLNQAKDYSHNAILMNNGRIAAADTTDKVITAANIESVYGVTMDTYTNNSHILWPASCDTL